MVRGEQRSSTDTGREPNKPPLSSGDSAGRISYGPLWNLDGARVSAANLPSSKPSNGQSASSRSGSAATIGGGGILRIGGTRGLFSAVMHVRQVAGSELADGLDLVMRGHGFVRRRNEPLSERAPDLPDDSVVGYACGPLRGDWCTVVQLHFYADAAMGLSDVGRDLSKRLNTHVLSLEVHDGDVFYYYLDQDGSRLDYYDSDPMYFHFKQEPLAESEVEARRHHPERFVPLLPVGVSLDSLVALLNSGWWQAHDKGELDAHGNLTDKAFFAEDNLLAGERMVAFGKLLQLHGEPTHYPYVAWADARSAAWSGFTLLGYAPE
jgi:hypothetical protein